HSVADHWRRWQSRVPDRRDIRLNFRCFAFLPPWPPLWCRAMLLPGTIAAEPPTGRAIWRSELIETIKLAWPIALTQLGQIAMMTTDLALIGRLGDGAVAAVALTHLILFCGFVVGMGPVSAVAALAAQAFGAREPRMVRRSLRMGIWASVLMGVPINVAQLWGEPILVASGQAPETAALAASYLLGITWSIIPGWCFI